MSDAIASRSVRYSTLQPELVATSTLSLTLTTLLTAARLATKISVARLQVEDYFLLIAWIALTAVNGLDLVATVRYGYGSPRGSIILINELNLYRDFWILEIAWFCVMLPVRTALSLQFHRFFCPNRSGTIFVANTMLMVFNILWTVACCLLSIFACDPPAKFWNPSIRGQCRLGIANTIVASAAFNVLADFMLLALPIWAVAKLHMRLKRKLVPMSVFSIGVFACICSIIRLVYTVLMTLNPLMEHSTEKVSMWWIAEMSSAFIVICVPWMPKFWARFVKRNKNLANRESPDAFLVERQNAGRQHAVLAGAGESQTSDLTRSELFTSSMSM